MTIGELIKDRDYDFIEIRIRNPETLNSVFVGSAKSENGELISLDGDTYSKDTKILGCEEWSGRKVKCALSVVCESL